MKKILEYILFSVLILSSCSADKITNKTGMKFVYIKSGKFIMGTKQTKNDEQFSKVLEELSKQILIVDDPSKKKIYEDEKFHEVTIDDSFYIQTTEVTQGQWFDIMGTKPWLGKPNVIDDRDRPVVYVSWNDVNEFIKKLNEKEETDKYRLPTEAEWEYSCRAGSTSLYNFDLSKNKLDEFAWFDENSLNKREIQASKVGSKKPNKLGVYDMYGNVWEWCSDWFKDYLDNRKINDDSDQIYKVFRGGAWDSDAMQCRNSNRNSYYPDYKNASLGFRLVKEN